MKNQPVRVHQNKNTSLSEDTVKKINEPQTKWKYS